MASKLRHTDGLVSFMCPGCGYAHTISVVTDEHFLGHPLWTWNGDDEKPTFWPSLAVADGSCHSFVKDGQIQFLPDCKHDLAGKTVELPDWDMPVPGIGEI